MVEVVKGKVVSNSTSSGLCLKQRYGCVLLYYLSDYIKLFDSVVMYYSFL